MTSISRYVSSGAIVLVALSMTTTTAQTLDHNGAGGGKPVSFGDAVRSADLLAPTPQYAALTTGLYARQIVAAAAPHDDYSVQVWSLLVAPKTTTGKAKLPGAAVLGLRSGSVEILTGGSKTRLKPGGTAAVAEGASLRIVNSQDSQAAQLRAIVLTSKR